MLKMGLKYLNSQEMNKSLSIENSPPLVPISGPIPGDTNTHKEKRLHRLDTSEFVDRGHRYNSIIEQNRISYLYDDLPQMLISPTALQQILLLAVFLLLPSVSISYSSWKQKYTEVSIYLETSLKNNFCLNLRRIQQVFVSVWLTTLRILNSA